MSTTQIKIEGMTCANCVVHVEKALEAVPSVKEAQVSIGEATVTHETTDEQLLRTIRAAGDYRGTVV